MVNYTPSLTSISSDHAQNIINQQNVYDLIMSFWQHQVHNDKLKVSEEPTKVPATPSNTKTSKPSKAESPYKSNKTIKGTGDPHELVPGADGKVHLNVTCFRCNYVGHYAHQCSVCFFQCADTSFSNGSDSDKNFK